MKQVEKYFWRVYDEVRKRHYTTRHRMSLDEAKAQGISGEPLEAGKLVVLLPETPEEHALAMHQRIGR